MSIHSPEELKNLQISVNGLELWSKSTLENFSDISLGDCQDVIHTPAKTATIPDIWQSRLNLPEKSNNFKQFHSKIPGHQFQSNLNRTIKNNLLNTFKKSNKF
jgi:hypothetical protein